MPTRSGPGRLVVGMGLPGSGKSSIFRALSVRLNARAFLEPEEKEWPDAVKRRNEVGRISALTWFRAIRVPMLYEASELRHAGSLALVDSYYDKLISLYIDHPAFSWLIEKADPYRAAYCDIAKLDYANLPDADAVVTTVVSEERWKELVLQRGRELDKEAGLLRTFESQAVLDDACKQYCESRGVRLIRLHNNFPSVDAAAEWLAGQLHCETNE